MGGVLEKPYRRRAAIAVLLVAVMLMTMMPTFIFADEDGDLESQLTVSTNEAGLAPEVGFGDEFPEEPASPSADENTLDVGVSTEDASGDAEVAVTDVAGDVVLEDEADDIGTLAESEGEIETLSEIETLDASVSNFSDLSTAITNATTGDTITITDDITLTEMITISGPNKNLNFVGATDGLHLYVNGDFRHFNLQDTTVDFGNLTLTRAPSYTGDSDFGGGIITDGTVSLTGGTISGNARKTSNESSLANYGGGVYVNSGNFTMEANAVISGNSAWRDGGGVYVYSGTFTMEPNTVISGNSAGQGGGVSVNIGIFTMNGGSISENVAIYGGGVYVYRIGGRFDMLDGHIIGNTANDSGGGVFIHGSYDDSGATFDMSGGDISDNEADKCGGGLVANPRTTVYLSGNAKISANKVLSPTVPPIFNNYLGRGGGIFTSHCTLTISDSVSIDGNDAAIGGGLFLQRGVTNLVGGSIEDNTAEQGGGIYAYYITSYYSASANISDTSIHNNSATEGGGLYVGEYSTVTMNGGSVSDNEAENGGGVYVYCSDNDPEYYPHFNMMTNGHISGNKATQNGGGIYVDSYAVATLANVHVEGNTAGYGDGNTGDGGGVYTANYANLTADASTYIDQNSATSFYFLTEADKVTYDQYIHCAAYSTQPKPTAYTVADLPSGYYSRPYNNYDVNYTTGAKAVSLVYKGNGSASGSVPAPHIYASNASNVTIPDNMGSLTKVGQTFKNWNTKADGSGTSYAPNAVFEIADDTVLYADWKINSYTVKFVDFDNSVLKTQPVDYNKNATAPANPTREGYAFTGWDRSFTGIKANLTVKAQYKLNTYAVKFVDFDGRAIDTQVVGHGSGATAPANPTREGYTFTGWDNTFSNITSELTVTALYEENEVVPTVPEEGPTTPSTPTGTTTPNVPSGNQVDPEAGTVTEVEVEEPTEPEAAEPVQAEASVQSTLSPEVVEYFAPADQARLEAQTGNIVTDLANGNVPLGGFGASGVWSLLNLILAAVAAVGFFIIGYSAITKRTYQFTARLVRLFAIIASALTFIVWVILGQLHMPTVWMDNHTPVIMLLFAITVGLTVAFNVMKRGEEYGSYEDALA
ncbi:MAG: InlB B-repeat-containing protein [Clostridiales Family XIII bacterium]|jgi:uncharacterized repeat protein (TIGR02543 family)|nr:InlB B-repeat-containing protein [Clostridiales Family XIII bacterium]